MPGNYNHLVRNDNDVAGTSTTAWQNNNQIAGNANSLAEDVCRMLGNGNQLAGEEWATTCQEMTTARQEITKNRLEKQPVSRI
jgi:hypothetical protein